MLLKLDDFCYKYDVSKNHVYVAKSKKLVAEDIIIEKNGKLFIDEDKLIRRNEFKERMINISHQHYYLLSRHFNTSEIASILNKIDPSISKSAWITFMSSELFTLHVNKILGYKMGRNMWKFFRYTRWILIYVFKKGGYKYEKICIKDLNYKLAELDEIKEKNGTSTIKR